MNARDHAHAAIGGGTNCGQHASQLKWIECTEWFIENDERQSEQESAKDLPALALSWRQHPDGLGQELRNRQKRFDLRCIRIPTAQALGMLDQSTHAQLQR